MFKAANDHREMINNIRLLLTFLSHFYRVAVPVHRTKTAVHIAKRLLISDDTGPREFDN